ncbi:MAG: peptide ABC transporter substrate-binding protein [Candidatus Sungiibacteriota bacterium]
MRKIIYLPHILSGQERKRLGLLIGIAILAGGGLIYRTYLRFTHPVPGIGGSYTEGIIGSPRSINPLYLSRDTDRDISRLVFSGLITYNSTGDVIPDLADRYEISRDGRVYTISLKKNVLWHDGAALTADDVIFTINRIQNPQYKSPARINWQGVETQKIDDYTIRFTLRTPYAPFIENLTQGIIPKHLWENINPEEALLHNLNLHPVGSGPYQFSRFKATAEGAMLWYALTRNPRYYREGPYLQTITLAFFNTEDEMIASIHKGEIDGFGPISSIRTKDANPGSSMVFSIATPRIFSIFFNTHIAPALADIAVREAIARAIDKSKIVQEASSGGAIILDSILPPFQKTFASGANQSATPAYDLTRARSVMDAAGWKDTDGDGRRDKKIRDSKKKLVATPLRFTLTTGDSPDLAHAAELIKTMLADIGISIDIEKRSFTELETAVIRPRAFEILLFGQVYGYEPDPFAFWHSSQIKDPGLNIALFADKKADSILEDARHTADREIRDQKYQEFARIAARALPAVPLYTQLYLYLLPRDMQFVEETADKKDGGAPFSRITLPADRFNEINRWYRTTRRAF